MTVVEPSTIVQAVRMGLQAGQRVRLHINGTSMSPILQAGDAVEVLRADPSQLECGDILVVDRDKYLVTHRAVKKETGVWITKGDAMLWTDAPGSVLGQVVAFERKGRRIDFDTPAWRLTNRVLGKIGYLESIVYGFFMKNNRNTTRTHIEKRGISVFRLLFRWIYWVVHLIGR